MYLVLIAWLYVTLMMALAEAAAPQGTLLGAIVTFVLYGLLPMGILGYILGTPSRKRAIRALELAEREALAAQRKAPSAGAFIQPDTGCKPPAAPQGHGVAPVRKEP